MDNLSYPFNLLYHSEQCTYVEDDNDKKWKQLKTAGTYGGANQNYILECYGYNIS